MSIIASLAQTVNSKFVLFEINNTDMGVSLHVSIVVFVLDSWVRKHLTSHDLDTALVDHVAYIIARAMITGTISCVAVLAAASAHTALFA